jgi:ribosomal protein S18 acetylase RimI-like enzyme
MSESADGPWPVADLHPGGIFEASGVLAKAFRDNPINRAVIGGAAARRLRCNRAGSRAALQAVVGHAWCRVVGVEDAARGVLLAEPPSGRALPLPPVRAQLRCLWVQGWAVAHRWQAVHGELAALRPAEPHWYLDLLGVAPEHQGRGVGRALLSDLLVRVDAVGAASYLETDRRENLAFYESAGYAVLSEEQILGLPVWRMWRPTGSPPREGRKNVR